MPTSSNADSTDSTTASGEAFAESAFEQSPGLVREFWDFLHDNKKWWLVPILLSIALLSLFVTLAASSVSPFLYVLF
ncbi:hypothetical protein FF011L_39250 [Roseimaritima multifibrata]|uniref:Uncharacterized protein n=2 Tax=Roseimaritima multifibrata TaxID=1930274 RepID=A0A517MJU5_9BACT|nr:hypothetical protein FF011L_39250 [Roseimaritima multifibrata]